MNNKKLLIGESITLVILIILIVGIFMFEANLGFFKLIKPQTILAQYDEITKLSDNLEASKAGYDRTLLSLDNAKKEYSKQKSQYDAISEDTVNLIKEATTSEIYSVEYIWIKIGNYAKVNNLTLLLVEPGGSGASTAPTPDTQVNSGTTTPTANPATPGATPPDTTSSGNELSIKVTGNYIDVSDFIFELENDKELRFKLDKIKMEYAGSNKITATFAVKNIKFKK